MDSVVPAVIGLIIELYTDHGRVDHGVAAGIAYLEGNAVNARAGRAELSCNFCRLSEGSHDDAWSARQ